MSRKLFVLVPPSEGKMVGGKISAGGGAFDERLHLPRVHIVESLAGLLSSRHHDALAKIMHAKGSLFDRAVSALTALAAGRAPLMPAWQRYTGVVWEHLEASTMSPAQRRRLLIPSGLYGVNTGMDLIADYRLKMDVTVPSVGGVASYWRPLVTASLGEHLAGTTVANLLPKEHASALDWSELSKTTTVVHVAFLSSDGRAAAGHAAKAVKGVLARSLIDHGVGVLSRFQWKGWTARHDDDVISIIEPRR